MDKIIKYALVYTTQPSKDSLVGFDTSSGGYPYPCVGTWGARLEDKPDSLVDHLKRYPGDRFKLVKVTLTFEDVE